jgi:predicted nucleic acid-binding protein
MIGPYFDTGLVLQLVIEEPLSAKVLAFVKERRTPIPFSRLMEVEIENALHAFRFRGAITQGQLVASRTIVSDLVGEGRFLKVDLSLDKIASETLSLVPIIAAKGGCRTLDLMHVATAKLLGVAEFVTTDKRQKAAASICGLQVVDFGDVKA